MGNLLINQGDEESLEIEGDDNIVALIVTQVTGQRLRIGFKDQGLTSYRPTQEIIFRLGVKELSAIRLSGAGTIEAPDLDTEKLLIAVSGAAEGVLHNLNAEELNIDLSGASSFEISGIVGSQIINISGAGSYSAKALESRDCDIAISGAGDAVVNATGTLNIEISGTGDIKYVGDPTVNQSISGTGSINEIEE
jgi:hypothetical protein